MLRPLVRPLVRALTRSPMESRGLRPTLSLDFTNGGVTDSRVTYSGGANGTRVNSAGLIVAATTPRYDYNPVTLAPLGLLAEEARTNLILQSRDLNTSPWLRGATLASLFTVTTDALLGPDGVGGVAKFVTGAVTEQGLFARELLTIPAATYAVTAYIYVPVQSGVTSWSLYVDLSDSVDFGQSATYTTFGQWVRASLSLMATVPRTFVDFNIRRNGVAPTNGDGFTFYVCCADIEAGSFPTSYIPTVASAVTRSADSAVMTGTNFSSWYNQTQGTFVTDASCYTATAASLFPCILSVDDTTSSNRIQMFRADNAGAPYAGFVVVAGGAVAANMNAGLTQMQPGKLAAAYQLNSFASSLNGATAATDVSGAVPTVTQMQIGGGVALNFFNGHVRSIRFFNQRLPNATLRGMTA